MKEIENHTDKQICFLQQVLTHERTEVASHHNVVALILCNGSPRGNKNINIEALTCCVGVYTVMTA